MNKKHKKTFFYIYAVNWWQGVWSFGLRPFYLEWHWMACFCADVPLRIYSLSLSLSVYEGSRTIVRQYKL